jgi:hypothetical protein
VSYTTFGLIPHERLSEMIEAAKVKLETALEPDKSCLEKYLVDLTGEAKRRMEMYKQVLDMIG